VKCRLALEAAVASPLVAHLAANTSLAASSATSGGHHHPSSLHTTAEPASVCHNSAAEQHVSAVVQVVGVLANACWNAVCEEEKPRPSHCQALLDTFCSGCLFITDMPLGLRQAAMLTISSPWPSCVCDMQAHTRNCGC